MVISEIFLRPTVKQIVFEIKFPNLLFIDSKIGEFQTQIMTEYPESNISYRKKIMFMDTGNKLSQKEIDDMENKEYARKIWEFKSPKDVQLTVSNDSINISSKHHITYNNPGKGEKFRDTIKFVVDNFFETIPIPKISRIGLRYIDEPPVPSVSNTEFKKWYNTCFPLDKFKLAESDEMFFTTVIKKEICSMRYIEFFKKDGKKYSYTLDFDGYATDIEREKYLEITGKLHDIIGDAFDAMMLTPAKEYMRKKREINGKVR